MSPTPVIAPESAESSQRTNPGLFPVFTLAPLWRGPLPSRTIALGTIGSVLLLLGSIGGAGVLVYDPVIGPGPLSALRYGHGKYLSWTAMYLGFGLLMWAWVRLGRGVLANLVGCRGVLAAMIAWSAPMLIAPPLFTRDVYSYLAQGLLALHGFDPYEVGPAMLTGPIPDNVHWFWQTTPAPYGPLFIAVAKGVVLVAGDNLISSVIVMRLVLGCGLLMLLCALPGLVRHLGGRLPVALWLVAASPMTVVHLIGGLHNDMLMIGLLALGTLMTLERRHLGGITLVTLAMAVKATAGIALPFLLWVWASHLDGTQWQRFRRALVPATVLAGVVFGATMLLGKVGMGWIPALSAPALIVNYISAPTGLGQAVHAVVSLFGDVDSSRFVHDGRVAGAAALVGILAKQWWRAREGGPDAVRRAAIALLATALLSPTTLPWYLTWSLALAAALPWESRTLSYVAGASVVLVLVYYPDGEQAMYNWVLMAIATGAAVLAAISLRRFDPLNLRRWLPRTESASGDATPASVPIAATHPE